MVFDVVASRFNFWRAFEREWKVPLVWPSVSQLHRFWFGQGVFARTIDEFFHTTPAYLRESWKVSSSHERCSAVHKAVFWNELVRNTHCDGRHKRFWVHLQRDATSCHHVIRYHRFPRVQPNLPDQSSGRPNPPSNNRRHNVTVGRYFDIFNIFLQRRQIRIYLLFLTFLTFGQFGWTTNKG